MHPSVSVYWSGEFRGTLCGRVINSLVTDQFNRISICELRQTRISYSLAVISSATTAVRNRVTCRESPSPRPETYGK